MEMIKKMMGIVVICALCLTACNSVSDSGLDKESANVDPFSKPYVKVTTFESSLILSPEELQTSNEKLKESLIFDKGLSESRADQLIQEGMFESRIIEVGEIESTESLTWSYVATATITVWKSEDYFSICNSSEVSFVPYSNGAVLSISGSDPWFDVEAGEFKVYDKKEVISAVFGISGELKRESTTLIPSKQYLKRISITD